MKRSESELEKKDKKNINTNKANMNKKIIFAGLKNIGNNNTRNNTNQQVNRNTANNNQGIVKKNMIYTIIIDVNSEAIAQLFTVLAG